MAMRISNVPVKTIVFVVLATAACLAAEPAKPPCNAHNRGQFWPVAANSDPGMAKRAARCGELQMCTEGSWRFEWQPLTVHISQLGPVSGREIPGCSATVGSPPKTDTAR